mmetsp:Transcript_32203/g.76579  ORF Transcript_32203/g.76579 Transcript_32203/m.76579 type:complete len:238 (+) Transcript_32203:1327-2040(+)
MQAGASPGAARAWGPGQAAASASAGPAGHRRAPAAGGEPAPPGSAVGVPRLRLGSRRRELPPGAAGRALAPVGAPSRATEEAGGGSEPPHRCGRWWGPPDGGGWPAGPRRRPPAPNRPGAVRVCHPSESGRSPWFSAARRLRQKPGGATNRPRRARAQCPPSRRRGPCLPDGQTIPSRPGHAPCRQGLPSLGRCCSLRGSLRTEGAAMRPIARPRPETGSGSCASACACSPAAFRPA